MTRTLFLGLIGLVLAVAVGLGVHLVTRETISLPVAKLEQAPTLAPPAARKQSPAATTSTTETATTTTETGEDDHGGNSGPGGGNSGRGSDDD